MGKFAVILKDVDMNNPPAELKGFLVPHEVDEVDNYIKRQDELFNDDLPGSLNLVIAVTMSCNYKCEYCFQGSHSANANMTEEVLADTIAYIKNEIDTNSNLKSLGITFFGGEPLLAINTLKTLSTFCKDYCNEKGIEYHAAIDTNGFFLTKEVSTELKEIGIVRAQIAIDGFEEFYNTTRKAPKESYKRVLNNIDSSELPIVIRVNVTKKNQEEVKQLLRYLYSLDKVKEGKAKVAVYRVGLNNDDPNYDFTDKEWLEFRDCMKDYIDIVEPKRLFGLPKSYCIGCSMQKKHNVVIGADGSLYRCDRHCGDSTKTIGTVKEGINLQSQIEKAFRNSVIDGECKNCKYLPICCGDDLCRLNLLEKGKPCELVKGKFKQALINYLTYVRG
jgi:uncharacterized protein